MHLFITEMEIEMEKNSVPSKGSPLSPVLPFETPRFKDHFLLGSKINKGQFGTIHHCTQKSTGKQFACKSIPKRNILCKYDVYDVRGEVQIMHFLLDHPNVVQIQGVYEGSKFVRLVMELCPGGDLFYRIIGKGFYSEKEAIKVMTTIVGIVKDLHFLGIMHRDIKPENFLFENHDEDAKMIVADFGLSAFFMPGQYFSDIVGSVYYIAPEVLRKHYGHEADVWSAGVILYILLSGIPPFWAESESGIFCQILHGDLDLVSEPWPSISESAKDLVKQMLEGDPKKRISAHEVLCHPWIVDDTVSPDKPLDSVLLTRLKQFLEINKLRRMSQL